MDTNKKLIYSELSYLLVGICFATHNELGRYAREKQYSDLIEKKLKESKIAYKREMLVGESNNKVDFLVENKVVLEIKAKRMFVKEDYFQLQRYLQESKIKLGFLINFRDKYLKPRRVVRIDTHQKQKFLY
ncbi:GxxExxY protein [Candidatus Woesebacteria bacterium]|nr:GxxExxY protein [Candidatus Woesebacteria bacterium]